MSQQGWGQKLLHGLLDPIMQRWSVDVYGEKGSPNAGLALSEIGMPVFVVRKTWALFERDFQAIAAARIEALEAQSDAQRVQIMAMFKQIRSLTGES